MDPPPWALCYSQAGPSPCTWWCWASLSLLVWKGICTTSLEEKTLVYPAWRSVPIGAYCSVTRVLSGCRVPLFVSLNTEGIEVACDIKSWWWDSNRVPWSPENGRVSSVASLCHSLGFYCFHQRAEISTAPLMRSCSPPWGLPSDFSSGLN